MQAWICIVHFDAGQFQLPPSTTVLINKCILRGGPEHTTPNSNRTAVPLILGRLITRPPAVYKFGSNCSLPLLPLGKLSPSPSTPHQPSTLTDSPSDIWAELLTGTIHAVYCTELRSGIKVPSQPSRKHALTDFFFFQACRRTLGPDLTAFFFCGRNSTCIEPCLSGIRFSNFPGNLNFRL